MTFEPPPQKKTSLKGKYKKYSPKARPKGAAAKFWARRNQGQAQRLANAGVCMNVPRQAEPQPDRTHRDLTSLDGTLRDPTGRN